MKTECECGKPVEVKMFGEMVCSDCAYAYTAYQVKAMTGKKQPRGSGGIMQRVWEMYHIDLSPICGASLLILDEWLKQPKH